MSVLVPLGDQGVGVVGGQGGVDVRLGVLPAQDESGGGLPVGGLVVDVLDFAGAVGVAEHVLCVVDARVHKAQQHAPPLQVQVGLALDLGHPRRVQGRTVQQAQNDGDGADKGGPQGLLQQMEFLRLHVRQHVPPGEHLPHHHIGGISRELEKGVGSPGDKINGIRRMDELQRLRRQPHGS